MTVRDGDGSKTVVRPSPLASREERAVVLLPSGEEPYWEVIQITFALMSGAASIIGTIIGIFSLALYIRDRKRK